MFDYCKKCTFFALLIFLMINSTLAKNYNKNRPLIIVNTNQTKCRMAINNCEIDVLVKNSLDLSRLVFRVNNEKYFRFSSFENCTNQQKKCLSFENFNRTISEINISFKNVTAHYTIRKIRLNSVLVGNSSLSVFFNDYNVKEEDWPMMLEHVLIATAPRRPVDIFFDAWTWSFGAIISLLMGILLDGQALLKIVKMPKAIAIGFCCQYILMPLMAFAIANIYNLSPVDSLAIFIYGCSPGGAG
jgi:predicted permease